MSVVRLPAPVAAVTGDDGAILDVQRFGRPDDGLASLVVGADIETVLSVVTAVPAMDAASVSAFAPPPGVVRDSDTKGERAAERFAPRCARARVAALCLVPQGKDFDDGLVSLGRTARARGPLHRNQVDAMMRTTGGARPRT